MQMPHDFPPIPKCFSHLLNVHHFSHNGSENDEQMLSQSLPLGTTFEHNRSYVRSLSENSQTQNVSIPSECSVGSQSRPLPYYQELFSEEDHQGEDVFITQNRTNYTLSYNKQKPILTRQSSIDEMQIEASQPDLGNPFVKLNSSLEKLQKEMKELRHYDVSLFCQLLSLHEAIQDLKFNIGDRYSETGSEYSLGSASYMGSMSSLDEESDWGDSQVFMHSIRGEESAADDDENRQSTSSLLEQITALTQRAEEEL